MWKILIPVLGVLILVGGGILVVRNFFAKDNVMDGDGMINPSAISTFRFSRDSSEMNSHYILTLEDEKLTVEDCAGNGYKTVTKTYTTTHELQLQMEEIIYEVGMRRWAQPLPFSEIQMLDGETTSVTVIFADETTISFSSERDVPEGGWEAVYKVVELMEEVIDK